VVNTERVTVTLPSNLLEGIARFEQNRSRFIAQAVEHELEHRRREELLRSVSSPHPGGDDLSELGTGDWLPDLVEDAAPADAQDRRPRRGVGGKNGADRAGARRAPGLWARARGCTLAG